MTYSVKDIQARYVVSQHTVLHWLTTGQMKGINVGRDPGKKKPRWRITQEALDAFEALRTPTPSAPRTRRRNKQASDVVEFYK